MIDCKSASESLSAWLDGELRASEAEAVRAHLEVCRQCGEQRRQMESLQAALKSALELQASSLRFEPFWREVEERITEKRTWSAAVTDFVRSALAAPRLAWAIPVVIVALLGALSIVPAWRAPKNSFASVESIDPYGRNVAVLRENETKTTVIWLYQNPEGENEPSSEAADSSSPSF
jgi:anti-sigma factor RsiW